MVIGISLVKKAHKQVKIKRYTGMDRILLLFHRVDMYVI